MSCELSFSITLSAEDTLRAQEALWRIVRRQAMLYAPESSSLPIETVTALMKSVLLTLNAAQNPAILLAPDLDALFWARAAAASSKGRPCPCALEAGHCNAATAEALLSARHTAQPARFSGAL